MPGNLTFAKIHRTFTFFEFEPAKVVAYDASHRHLPRGMKVLLGHLALELGRFQDRTEFTGEILRIPDLIKANCYVFIGSHHPKICNVSTHDWHSILASLVGRPAGAGCGIVGHD